MKKILAIIEKNLNGKKIVLLFLLTNLVYVFMLKVTIPMILSFAKGMKTLDMMPLGYDSDYIKTFFDTLGERGRSVYLYYQIPVDMVYPFLFGLSYCLLIAYFLKKLHKLKTPYIYLCFLPIIAGLADYAENLGIINMLTKYPELTPFSMHATNAFSIVKSMTTTFYFAALIITLIVLGIKFLRGTLDDRRN